MHFESLKSLQIINIFFAITRQQLLKGALMAINSIWNNNSPMDYLGFLSTDPDNNTEDNEWLTPFSTACAGKAF